MSVRPYPSFQPDDLDSEYHSHQIPGVGGRSLAHVEPNNTVPSLAIFYAKANSGIYFWVVGASRQGTRNSKNGQLISKYLAPDIFFL